MLPRTTLHSAKLVRCLADLDVLDTAGSGNAFAEKIGAWIHFADAITLSAVHNHQIDGIQKRQPGKNIAACAAVRGEFDRVKAALGNSIRKSCSHHAAATSEISPALEPEHPLDIAVAYAPYRRIYESHQRDMDISIQPLRHHVRGAIANLSPRLRKLAELDATFEKILRDRESRLLSRVPVLLGKRFQQLLENHQQKLAEAGAAGSTVARLQMGSWLACYCGDMQMLLLAEMDLRLQPTIGLIEACKNDTDE